MSWNLGTRSLTNTNFTVSTAQFDLATLWTVTKAIYDLNPRNESLYHPYDNQSRICLRYDACLNYAGEGYTEYTTQDFWDIISAWRIPLIALIATTPLPAYGFLSWIFAIVHMLADPIDTLWSLFYKLALARRNEEWALHKNKDGLFSLTGEYLSSGIDTPQTGAHSDNSSVISGPARDPSRAVNVGGSTDRDIAPTGVTQAHESGDSDPTDSQEGLTRPAMKRSDFTFLGGIGGIERDQLEEAARHSEAEKFRELDAKNVALIINAYDDWHFMDLAKALIINRFSPILWDLDQRKSFRSSCNAAAALLAADRVAKFLPSIVTSIVFFAQIAASFWKTLYEIGDTPNPSDPNTVNFNRVPHNIAFGVLYFWLPFVIILTAFVGGPQTENSVPRILNIFRADALQIFKHDLTGTTYSDKDTKLRYLEYSTKERIQRLSSWHLDKYKDWSNPEHAKFTIFWVIFSIIIITIPAVAAIELSWRTPTGGFSCRTTTQVLFWFFWIVRFGIDIILVRLFPEKRKSRDIDNKGHGTARNMWIYYISWWLDFLLVAAGTIVITYVSKGLFNDCACWSQWGTDHDDRYISFPQEQYVFDTIRQRLIWEFSFVVGGALALEAILFIFVAIYFWKGYKVLRQDDIDKEIAAYGSERSPETQGCLARIGHFFGGLFAGVRKIWPSRSADSDVKRGKAKAQPLLDDFQPRTPLRTKTSAMEMGNLNDVNARRPSVHNQQA